MSNKLVKNKPKIQTDAKKDKTVILEDDPKFIKLLKMRLVAQSEKNPKKGFFNSSIMYLIVEVIACAFGYTYLYLPGVEESITLFGTLLLACILLSAYNIIVSLIQIFKLKYRVQGNIVLIVMHIILIICALQL